MVARTNGDTSRTKIGDEVVRREDAALLTGSARYTDDISDSRLAHVTIMRSRHAHASIDRVSTRDAENQDGVLGVFTAADLDMTRPLGDIPVWLALPDSSEDSRFKIRKELRTPRRPMLANERVRYTGEPVAVVVAEDRYTAHSARNLIDVEYQRLEPVVDPLEATSDGVTRLHEEAPDNIALDWEVGDASLVDSVFDDAAHTVGVELINQRLIPNPMEPRAAIADFHEATGRLTMQMSTQVPHEHRRFISESLDIPEHKIRVIAPKVGGGFGNKSKFYPSDTITAWCSEQVGRPTKWVSTRTESYVAGIHGRGHVSVGDIALDDDGQFCGLRVRTHADIGAYLSKVTPRIVTGAYVSTLTGPYEIPAVHCRVTGVFTNKAPIDAYRGAGRPEGTYIVERLIHLAADETDLDPAELRRRNLISPDDFPYETPVGSVYDSGEYEKALDEALELVGYEELKDARRQYNGRGRCLGIGIASYVEESGVSKIEGATIRFHPSGTLTAICGTTDQGQGHETTFTQILTDILGIPEDDIEIIEGDTAQIEGTGTYGSRSAMAGGSVLVKSARVIIEKGRRIAASELEAAVNDIEFEDGRFAVRGAPDRSVSLQDIAKLAYLPNRLPDGIDPGLEATSMYETEFTYPFGTHIAVVEVDPNSGELDLQQYAAVNDCGVQINPKIVEGQMHGAIAQGIGQALFEEAVYDDTGNLVTGSMQDYTVPKTTHIPEIELGFTTTPSPRNPLGVKGIGEGGTLGPPPAIVNAVVDALSRFDVKHIDMPVTPEKVWLATNSNP